MQAVSDVIEAAPTRLFIAREWREDRDHRRFPVEDPATGEILCEVTDGSADDGMAALDAAAASSDAWAQHSSRTRAELFRRAYEALMRQQDELALLITLEMGKPLAESGQKSPTAPNSSVGSRRKPPGSPGLSSAPDGVVDEPLNILAGSRVDQRLGVLSG